MTDFSAFPKIFAIGQPYIQDIFRDPVEVTEKVDGSQFCFGMLDGTLRMRSKGKEQFTGAVDKMFLEAAEYVHDLSLDEGSLRPGWVYYAEYLRVPKHNTLKYDCVPTNHLMLFGASSPDGFFTDWWDLEGIADDLQIDVAPMLFQGRVESMEHLQRLLETDSFLGGCKVEGVVVKNYARSVMVGERAYPIMCGKFVSERFKEKHQAGWTRENTARGKWDVYKEAFRTDARWEKAIQHLRDDGLLENSPRDIGPLIKEIQRDITEEQVDEIKDYLWSEFGPDLLRKSVAGFAEWYKERIAAVSFGGES